MKNIYIFFFIFILTIFSVHSTEPEASSKMTFGVFGSLNCNTHSADFQKIPDCPSCSPGYESGSGFGPTFGLTFDGKVADNFFVGANLTYLDYSALLSRIEETKIILNDVPSIGEFEHTLDVSLASIGIEPNIKYYFNSSRKLYKFFLN